MTDDRPVVRGQIPAEPPTACHACPVRSQTICAALKPDDLFRLDETVQRIEVNAPKHIFLEADVANFVYVITDGVVILSKLLRDGRRQITGLLFPGDFIGLATDGTYNYSAEPVRKVSLCRFSRSELRQLCAEFPEMEHRLLEYASHELAAARDHILLLGRMSATQKVASLLLMFQKRQQRPDKSSEHVLVPLGRAEIADYLGLRLETVGRALSQLVDDGIIDVPKPRRIAVLKQDVLNDIAAGSDVDQLVALVGLRLRSPRCIFGTFGVVRPRRVFESLLMATQEISDVGVRIEELAQRPHVPATSIQRFQDGNITTPRTTPKVHGHGRLPARISIRTPNFAQYGRQEFEADQRAQSQKLRI